VDDHVQSGPETAVRQGFRDVDDHVQYGPETAVTLQKSSFPSSRKERSSNNKYHRRLPQMHDPQDDPTKNKQRSIPRINAVSIGLAMIDRPAGSGLGVLVGSALNLESWPPGCNEPASFARHHFGHWHERFCQVHSASAHSPVRPLHRLVAGCRAGKWQRVRSLTPCLCRVVTKVVKLSFASSGKFRMVLQSSP